MKTNRKMTSPASFGKACKSSAMGRRLAALLGISLLAVVLAATPMLQHVYAETYPTFDTDFRVRFDGASLTSNYDASVLQKALQGMQPGDEASLEFTLINDYDSDVDWWMENEVLKSFEDLSGTAAGGAYTYEVTYTPASGGSAQTLYQSAAVGGEQTARKDLTGMHEATDALDEYLWLETIPANAMAKLTIHFALDGETQANNYQDTLGRFKVDFAVELPGSGNGESGGGDVKTMKPRTGDDTDLAVYIAAAAVSLLVLLILLLRMQRVRKGGEA